MWGFPACGGSVHIRASQRELSKDRHTRFTWGTERSEHRAADRGRGRAHPEHPCSGCATGTRLQKYSVWAAPKMSKFTPAGRRHQHGAPTSKSRFHAIHCESGRPDQYGAPTFGGKISGVNLLKNCLFYGLFGFGLSLAAVSPLAPSPTRSRPLLGRPH